MRINSALQNDSIRIFDFLHRSIQHYKSELKISNTTVHRLIYPKTLSANKGFDFEEFFYHLM